MDGTKGKKRKKKRKKRRLPVENTPTERGITLFLTVLLLGMAVAFSFFIPPHLLRCERKPAAAVEGSAEAPETTVASCSATRLVLFVVPCWYQRVDGVKRASFEVRHPPPHSWKRDLFGRREPESTEKSGYLTVTGGSGRMTLEVSPASRRIAGDLRSFLASGEASFTRYTLANWKFGLLGPGVPGLLGLFCARIYLILWIDWRRNRPKES